MTTAAHGALSITVNGVLHEVLDETASLLDVLRDELGEHAVKDGCAPQGQCGCCTVLVDGAPRVACVTPVRRVRGKSIETPDVVADADAWAAAFVEAGAAQCGFCTPGIIARLAGLRAKRPDAGPEEVEQALLAHLCRCTGWRTILDAWDRFDPAVTQAPIRSGAAARAELEGHVPQRLDTAVALGDAGFADDGAPVESLVAVLDPDGAWTLGESVAAARAAAGTVQGRRTTADAVAPIDVPTPPADTSWDVVLQTSWVEPGYLETDASWAAPGGDPADPLANGGAFGGKTTSPIPAAAATLASEAGRPVRALWRREDVVRHGPKRPPLAAGLRADGTGIVHVARTPGVVDRIRAVLPNVEIEEVDIPGPPTSIDLRGAGWVEATALAAALDADADPASVRVTQPGGGTAIASLDDDGAIHVTVSAGDPLDSTTLVSYCIGAAHQAASWVTSEAIAVDDEGRVHDLTIRSFGILRAVDTPPIEITVEESDAPALAVSDAVFAAVAAAVWRHQGRPVSWPTGIALREGIGAN